MIQKILLTTESNGLIRTISAVQGDNDRILSCEFSEWIDRLGVTCELWAKRPDGTVAPPIVGVPGSSSNLYDVRFDITQALTQAGRVTAQIKLKKGGKVLSTFNFYIDVVKNIEGSATPQERYWITSILEQIESRAEEVERIAETLPPDYMKLADDFNSLVIVGEEGVTEATKVQFIPKVPNISIVTYDELAEMLKKLDPDNPYIAPFVVPQTFGAVADGVHDDTEALLSAINTGLPVVLPKGTYAIYRQITQGRDINITGFGDDSVIKLMPADKSMPEEYDGRIVYNCYMFTQPRTSHGYDLSLSNLVLDCNKDGFDQDILHNGASRHDHTVCVDLYKPGDVTFKNVTFKNALIEGCYVYSPAGSCLIDGCKFLGNGYFQEDASGLHLEGNHSNTTVSNCIFNSNGFHGLLLGGANGAHVSNVSSSGNGYDGVCLWGGSNNNVLTGVDSKNNRYGLCFRSTYNPYYRDSYVGEIACRNIVSGLHTSGNKDGLAFGVSADNVISGWISEEDKFGFAGIVNDETYTDQVTAQIFGRIVDPQVDEHENVGGNSWGQYEIEFGSSGEQGGGVEDYVIEEAERVIGEVQKHAGFRMIAMSDMHVTCSVEESGKESYVRNSMTSMQHAGESAAVVRDSIPMDAFAILGDYTWGDVRTTKENCIDAIKHTNKWTADASKGIPNFRTQGNHDSIVRYQAVKANRFDAREMASWITSFADSNAIYDLDNPYGGYFYQDFPKDKIRVFCANSADLSDNYYDTHTGHYPCRMSGKQFKFFAEKVLNFDDYGSGRGWGVLLLSHHPLDWGSNGYYVTKVVKAYINGENLSTTIHSVSVEANFSYKNYATIIANIHGHVHNYKSDKLHEIAYNDAIEDYESVGLLEVQRLAIPNVCPRRSNEYGQDAEPETNNIEYGEDVTYEKTVGTANDTAYCVVTVDTENQKIHLTHYGAGYDREVTYENKNKHDEGTALTLTEGMYISSTTGEVSAKDGYHSTVDIVPVTPNGSYTFTANNVFVNSSGNSLLKIYYYGPDGSFLDSGTVKPDIVYDMLPGATGIRLRMENSSTYIVNKPVIVTIHG